MPVPVSYFSYVPNELVVQFNDHSSNVPTSWAWNFGDAGTATSQNPSHTYDSTGHYDVSLIATNADGSSTATVLTIGVSSLGLTVLPKKLYLYIDQNLPTGVEIPLSNKVSLIRKWQEFISILVDREISDANIYNEYYYSALENELITLCVVLDLILNGANQWLLSNQGDGSSVSGTQLKKIVTGPSEAEYFNQSEDWLNIMKPGGIYQQLQARCCHLAARLRISLPFCPALKFSPIIPSKQRIDYPGTPSESDILTGNPFGIPSEFD